MSADKLITVLGFLAKLEGSYNAGATVTAADDGHQLAELPEFTPEWGNDGVRGAPPATFGHQRKVAPTGRHGGIPLKLEAKGAGSAYSASVVPQAHVLLRAAGFDAALTSTAGAEKYVYTPTAGPTGFASLAGELYARGEKWPFTGGYLDWELGADGPGIPLWAFTLRGLLTVDPTDVAVPSITYPLAAIDPAKAVGASLLSINAVTSLVLRSWSIKGNREIAPRLNQNTAAGLAGFAPGRRAPTLELTFETPAKATFDPEALWKAATEMATTITVGSVQYKKFNAVMPKVQIASAPTFSADGNISLTTLSCQLNPSTLTANDELTLTFD